MAGKKILSTPDLSIEPGVLLFWGQEMMKQLKSVAGILGMAVLLAGCSATNEVDYGKVDLIQAGGTVTLDGTPLASAVVTFDNPETGTFSYARTDGTGKYTLQFDTEKSGVTPGQKIVQISTARTILGLDGEEAGERRWGRGRSRWRFKQ